MKIQSWHSLSTINFGISVLAALLVIIEHSLVAKNDT